MRVWTALLIIAVAIVLFVFLVPIPIPALQPSPSPSYLEPVTIYGSIASKFFGSGAVVQFSYFHSNGTRAYCIQQPFRNGYLYSCLP